jgi:NAD(P)-dependent dehydrogenase (short-subunit alcohol dehydrogenase family)
MGSAQTARSLGDAVAVVTGGSSGIGRATALRFARRGARLALAARAEEPLRQARDECSALGAETIALPTDVGDEEQVERLANEAVERFGRVDVWVNAAAVMAYGDFERIPSDVFRTVIQTNLFGQSHGARSALRRFREQGSGVLINLASVWGRVTTPAVSPYVVSKHAIRALSECLRQELREASDIHVVTILPEAVDTPIFEHAANFAGRRVRPIPPLVDVDEVAQSIERCAEFPKREITFGRAGRSLELLHTFLPQLYERIAPPMFTEGTFLSIETGPDTGNVLCPRDPHTSDGGWKRTRRKLLRRGLAEALGGAASGLIHRGRH